MTIKSFQPHKLLNSLLIVLSLSKIYQFMTLSKKEKSRIIKQYYSKKPLSILDGEDDLFRELFKKPSSKTAKNQEESNSISPKETQL